MTYDTINDAVTIAGGAGALLVGRYRIVKQLGQGGMGSVWLVEDTELDNKPFAIKMLPSILVSNKRAYRQLKDEALVAMRLVHPNIVQIRAFEENKGNPFLVMDYIDGKTLDDYLAEKCKVESVECKVGGGISEDEVIRILKPIAVALDYAHGEGVVHRDIKPSNVMIRKDGHPFILDFGIAREIQETMTRVTGKLSSGTLLYMSPEQLMGESPKPAQDVYSFAAMVYECLKGEPPFSHGQIEFQILNKPPEPLTGKAAILAAGVMAGLAKKPEGRPATCAEVLEEKDFGRVEHVDRVEGGNGRARSPSGPQPVGRRVPTPPQSGGPRPVAAVKGILIAALFAALVGGAWWWLGGGDGTIGTNGTTGTNVVQGLDFPSPVLPVPSGPTESDVTDIAVEATVQKARVERIDDADGFSAKKIALADDFTRATANGKSRRWADAAQSYTNYVDGCKALVALDVERQAATISRAKANDAKLEAERCDAENYAATCWRNAVRLLESGNDEFRMMNFASASNSFASAEVQLRQCAKDAKAEQARQAVVDKIRAEALSLRDKVVGMSDEDGFKVPKDKLEEVFKRAAELYDKKEKLWIETAQGFSNYVAQANALIKLDAERLTAVSARNKAEEVKQKAEKVEAGKYAATCFEEAIRLFSTADGEFSQMKFSVANTSFELALKHFENCVKEARERKAMQSLPGKWACSTRMTCTATISGASHTSEMIVRYEIEFYSRGEYVEKTSMTPTENTTTTQVTSSGHWNRTGDELTLTPQSGHVMYGDVFSNNLKGKDLAAEKCLVIWHDDGAMELRTMAESDKEGISSFYDDSGKHHIGHKSFTVIETAKIFRRISKKTELSEE